MDSTQIQQKKFTSNGQVSLQELKEQALPRLSWRDIFTVNEGGEEGMPEEDKSKMNDYFRQFLTPGPCVKCGSQLTGDIIHQFTGQATFTWGIATGEGFCSKCKYPARALHRDVGPIKFVNLVLQYHPDELEAVRVVQTALEKHSEIMADKENPLPSTP